jgi:hypothetical protein
MEPLPLNADSELGNPAFNSSQRILIPDVAYSAGLLSSNANLILPPLRSGLSPPPILNSSADLSVTGLRSDDNGRSHEPGMGDPTPSINGVHSKDIKDINGSGKRRYDSVVVL